MLWWWLSKLSIDRRKALIILLHQELSKAFWLLRHNPEKVPNRAQVSLLHLPRMEGYEPGKSIRNGPALAGHGAEAVRDAITRSMTSLHDQLRQSLTWDQGAEMAQHGKLRIDTCLQIYFCDPQSPWQRGTNENTNGLLRQYFPKGTDLSQHSEDELNAVAHAINMRPRKTLAWKTPAEVFEHLLVKR